MTVPIKPDYIIEAELQGYEPFWDEESGEWIVGDDIGDLEEDD